VVREVLIQEVYICEDALMTDGARVRRADMLLENFLRQTSEIAHSTGARVFRGRVIIQS
jgi:hypothetical protein